MFDVHEIDETPQEDYVRGKLDNFTAGLGDEMGAWVSRGLDWNLSYRMANWLRLTGDETIMPEEVGEDAPFRHAAAWNKRRETKLSQSDYNARLQHREPLKKLWHSQMNDLNTDYLIRKYDEEQYRNFIFEHRKGGWRTIAGMGLMFATNAIDPTNYIPFVPAAARSQKVGRLLGLSTLVAKNKTLSRLVINVSDAAVGTALADSVIIPMMHAEGREMPWSELGWDVLISVGVGGLLTSAGVGVTKLRRNMDGLDVSSKVDEKAFDDVIKKRFGDETPTPEQYAATKAEYDAHVKQQKIIPPEKMSSEAELTENLSARERDVDEDGWDKATREQHQMDADDALDNMVARKNDVESPETNVDKIADTDRLESKRGKAQAKKDAIRMMEQLCE